jgi:hypothetical protein
LPLAFDSLSHGKVAFGFFNIETDLLLLNRYFFFTTDFCRLLVERADALIEGKAELILRGYSLAEERIGNLMGAIHGLVYQGFIGEVYRIYPFPAEPAGFKQNPEGYRTRSVIEQVVVRYGRAVDIPFRFRRDSNEVAIGAYLFNQEKFRELLRYIWLGGYPRWRNGRRPPYVEEMLKAVERAGWYLFEGIEERWEEKRG